MNNGILNVFGNKILNLRCKMRIQVQKDYFLKMFNLHFYLLDEEGHTETLYDIISSLIHIH